MHPSNAQSTADQPRRHRGGSWRTRLVAGFLALLATVALWEVRHLRSYHDARVADVMREQRLLAESVAAQVDMVFEGIRRNLAVVADSIEQHPPRSATEAKRYLQEIRPLVAFADLIVLTDADGVVLAAAPEDRSGVSILDREAVHAVLREGRNWAVNSLVRARVTGRLVVGAAHALRDARGRTTGAVVVGIRDDSFAPILARGHLSADGSAVLIDSHRRAVYSTREPGRPWERRDVSGSPRVAAALAGEARVYERYESEVDGAVRAGAVVPVRGIGWAVGVSRDRETMLAPVRREIAGLAARGAVLPLLLLAGGVLVVRRLLRPLQDLSAGAEALGAGRLDVRIREDDSEEFAAVDRAFNAMAERIERHVAAEEAARQRADWLAAASAELAATLDYEATLVAATRLAVGRLGTCCAVDVVDDAGRARRLAERHTDPACPQAAGGRDRCPMGPPLAADEVRAHRAELVSGHLMRLPLRSRGRIVGRLSIALCGTARRFGHADLTLAEELARRAALAAENALLYREARSAEARLRHQLDYTRAITRSLGEGVVALDPDGRVTFANPTAESILGRSEQGLLGRVFHEVVHPEEPTGSRQAERCPLSAALAEGQAVSWSDDRFADARGVAVPVDVTSSPVVTEGDRAGIVLAFRDTTEQKRLEEELRQAQKMEAVGRLAGGVAHDFNNVLTAILGYTDLILHAAGDEAAVRREASEVRRAADRAANLTQQLLAFSRKQTLKPVVVDLNAVVADVETMLRRVIGEDIELVTRLDPEAGRIRADPGQVTQVLLNLAVNARDAMPAGGRLAIETRTAVLEDPAFLRRAQLRPGRYAVLVVRDSGIGMDAETQTRLFEPFFTTKARGKGTGLGLSTVYGIVKQSQGHIAVESAPGEGATFAIYLPSVEGREAPAAAPALAAAPAGGRETVLLVEDDDMVRRYARQVLESRGYRILEARLGEEAVELARQAGDDLALLLTDVVMPGMNGREVATRLADIRPGIRVLYMSGYTENIIGEDGILTEDTDFLPKPFTPGALLDRVRAVLDRRDSRVTAP